MALSLEAAIEAMAAELPNQPQSQPTWTVLRDRMSQLSEDAYCAGWLINLEYVVWWLIVDNPDKAGFGLLSYDDIKNQLYEIAKLAKYFNCWVMWDDTTMNEVRVSLDDWITIYSATNKNEAK